MPDAGQELTGRLYSYGRAPPKALVMRRQPGAGARLDPLSSSPLGASLGKRGGGDALARSGRDGASGAFGDSLGHSDSRGKLGAHSAELTSSGPLPYAKMARSAAREAERRAAFQPAPAPAPASSSRATPTAVSLAGPAAAAEEQSLEEKRRDPFWFIKMLRTELSDHEFAYMNVADTDGTTWDPYNLKIVAFSDVNPNNHYTISEAGVTHCIRRGKEEIAEFTPLEQWEKECSLFQEVMEIPFFKRYQSWKSYYSWKRAIQSDKIASCRGVLTRHLFILNDTFQPSLLRVRGASPPR